MGFFDSLRREKKQKIEEQVQETVSEQPSQPEVNTDSQVESPAAVTSVPTPPQAPLQDVNTQEVTEGETQSVTEEETTELPSLEELEEVSTTPTPDYSAYTATPIKSYADKKPVNHTIGITKIIAIINQKGGVGKSTTAINLSAALGEAGKQVLLIDLDPQGNATSGLGIDKSQISHCIYDVLLDNLPLEDVIVPDVCEGVDIAPATINLAGADVELVSEMARENRLKDAVGRMRGKYDYIFIDCPPSLGLLTVNALVGADKLIIPIQTEFYALEGVTKLLESMKRVKSRLNPSLDIFGILLTMYDGRTTLSRQVAAEVRNFFNTLVFETIIPRTVKLSEAPSYGMPITQYDPSGKGAQAYKDLAEEVINRG